VRGTLRPARPDELAATAAGLRAWLTSGAAQGPTGAFAAWVDVGARRRAYAYPEITGYALTWLAGLETLTARERAAGERAARWLAARVEAGRLAARDGWDGDAVYVFDLGMIATGLLAFGRRVGEQAYAAAGARLAALVAGRLAGPAIAAASGSRRRGWSVDGVAHLAKLVQPLLLAEVGLDAAARVVEAVARLQAADGRFDVGDACVLLHPHLYAAEGLWAWGTATGDAAALERAAAAVEWAWRLQLPSGGLPRSDERDAPEQSELTAQAVRLALALGVGVQAAAAAARRLCATARPHGGALALPYQPGAPAVHLNTWATLFGAQALALAAPGARALAWHELV